MDNKKIMMAVGSVIICQQSFVEKKHLVNNGLHHEICLVDFTKVDSQEGLRTILREPVKK